MLQERIQLMSFKALGRIKTLNNRNMLFKNRENCGDSCLISNLCKLEILLPLFIYFFFQKLWLRPELVTIKVQQYMPLATQYCRNVQIGNIQCLSLQYTSFLCSFFCFLCFLCCLCSRLFTSKCCSTLLMGSMRDFCPRFFSPPSPSPVCCFALLS